MVSSITPQTPPPVADAPRVVAGPKVGVPAGHETPTAKPTPAQVEKAVAEARQAVVAKSTASAPAQPLVSGPLVPPLTSLALYKDSESGMQVSVVRERISGQIVEQIPNERARRLAAMMRDQQQLAQELQRAEAATRLDLET